jgi:DNA-binding response OmpR family regulator
MTTILIVERDDAAMRLMAWGMREEGYTVVTSAGADELLAGERVAPDVIVFNTCMAVDIKRLWVSALRYIVPYVDIIDLCTTADISTYDTGADGYMEAPYRVDKLVSVIEALRGPRESGSSSEPTVAPV